MGCQLIDGRAIAGQLHAETSRRVAQLRRDVGLVPGLAVVLVGEDPASISYVRAKEKKAVELGLGSWIHRMPAATSQEELLATVDQLNRDPAVHGILIQSPLPGRLDERAVLDVLSPQKDVDGFHPVNLGRTALADPGALRPCTPAGILELLRRSGIVTRGRHAVLLGRSRIVGLPLSLLLMQKEPFGADATLTVCHSRSVDLAGIARQADILISAVGKPNMVTGDMVRPGAVVVDVGVNRVADPAAKSGYRLVGDVDFPAVSKVAGWLTPVPGGVGPMTIAMLMANTVQACLQQLGLAAPATRG